MTTNDQGAPVKKTGGWVKALLRTVGVGMALALLYHYFDGITVAPPGGIGYLFISFSFIAYLILVAADTRRWQQLVNYFYRKADLGFVHAFVFFTLMLFVGQFTSPVMSNTIGRASLLKKGRDITYGQSVVITIYPRIFDVVILAVLVIPSLLWISGTIGDDPTFIAGGALLVLLILFGVIGYDPERFIRLINDLLTWVATTFPVVAPKLVHFSLDRIPEWPILRMALGYSVIRYVAVYARMMFLLAAFHIDMPMGVFFLALPILQLSIVTAFAPGALGTLEIGWAAVLVAVGAADEVVTSFLIWNRILEVVFMAAGLGIGYFFYLTVGVNSSPEEERKQ